MTLLVGLDNPRSRDPRFALYPAPEGSTGYRICEMIGAALPEGRYTRAQYLRDFSRVDLYPIGRAKNGKGATAMDRAMAGWVLMYADQGKHQTLVLLGERVRLAFGHIVDWEDPLACDTFIVKHSGGRTFYSMPHPSGRNHWYNDTEHRALAGGYLAALRNEDN